MFLTMDKGVEYEQNLKRRSIAIMILRANSNRLVDLLPLVQDCVRQMGSIRAGQIVRIGGRGRIFVRILHAIIGDVSVLSLLSVLRIINLRVFNTCQGSTPASTSI